MAFGVWRTDLSAGQRRGLRKRSERRSVSKVFGHELVCERMHCTDTFRWMISVDHALPKPRSSSHGSTFPAAPPFKSRPTALRTLPSASTLVPTLVLMGSQSPSLSPPRPLADYSSCRAAKIWQCYQGLAAQSLYITDDNHIAVENGPGQCLDVQAESSPDTSGPYPISKRLQTWDCTFGNANQVRGEQ